MIDHDIADTGTTKTPIHVRWINRRDFPEVLAIDLQSFPPGQHWPEEEFLGHLRRRNCIGMVATLKDPGETVVGFALYDLHKDKLSVLRLAIHPAYRRQGVGSQMVEYFVSRKLSHDRRTRMEFQVDERNDAAHLFLRASGGMAVKVLKGEGASREFGDEPGDAYLFEVGWAAARLGRRETREGGGDGVERNGLGNGRGLAGLLRKDGM